MKRLPFIEYQEGSKFYGAVQLVPTLHRTANLYQRTQTTARIFIQGRKNQQRNTGNLGTSTESNSINSFQYRWDGTIPYHVGVNVPQYLQGVANDNYTNKAHQQDIILDPY